MRTPMNSPFGPLSRRSFLSLAGTACLGLGARRSIAAGSASAARPNIIFILSDDLAQGDLGCYGQKLIQTPHLDRMAAEGTRYHAGLLRHHRLRAVAVLADDRPAHRATARSAPTARSSRKARCRCRRARSPSRRLLKDAGYATACIGKWGMGMFDTTGSPLKKGFDHFFGYNCQRHAHSYFPTYLYNDDQRFDLPGNDGKGVGKTYAQDLIADETLAWVRAHKDQPVLPLLRGHAAARRGSRSTTWASTPTSRWTAQQKNYAAHGHAARQRRRPAARPAEGTEARREDARHLRRRQRLVVRPRRRSSAGSSTRRATGCAASSAACTKAACARRPSPAGRASCRPAASATSRGRSGISCRPPPNWPARSCRPASSRTASRSSRSSRAAPRRSATTSTGNCTKAAIAPGRALRRLEGGAQRPIHADRALRPEDRPRRDEEPRRREAGPRRPGRGPDEGRPHGGPQLAAPRPSGRKTARTGGRGGEESAAGRLTSGRRGRKIEAVESWGTSPQRDLLSVSMYC